MSVTRVANAAPAGEPGGVQAKFAAMRADMQAGLIERDDEIDLVLTAMIAGHHPLLVGEPGTAKSLLGRAVAQWLGEGNQFEVLLSKFTDPTELFGPVSIEGLKRDEYRRITTGTMLDAPVVFLDEIFKASPAILNTTLGVLNERKYRNGRGLIECPLVMAVAASNEWPQDSETGGKELGALFDRFLFRKVVKPIRSPEGRDRLLWTPNLGVRLSTEITADEVGRARREAASLAYTDAAKEAVFEVIHTLEGEGIVAGDRRKRWSVEAGRAAAYLAGAKQVEREHLEVLAHTLWVDPREQPEKAAAVVAKITNPHAATLSGLVAELEELFRAVPPRVTFTTENVAILSKITDTLARLAEVPGPKAKAIYGVLSARASALKAKVVR
jgi:MoxR-like ATPase